MEMLGQREDQAQREQRFRLLASLGCRVTKAAVAIANSEIPNEHVAQENASEMLTNAFDMVKQQRKQERRHHALILVGVLLAIVLFFLGDTMGWMGMFFVVAPCLCVALAIGFVIYGIWRKRNHLPCSRTFILAAVLILFPVALIAFFFIAGILGLGPVPS